VNSPAVSGSYESGQVPVGQLEFPDEAVFDRAAKVEKIFSVFDEPHFSHVWGLRLIGPKLRPLSSTG